MEFVKYIVAVSGGVDSVVLLDLMSRANKQIIVAHFDHGIRADSAADARFVQLLADRYSVKFVSCREELGADASEDLARSRRYDFLRRVADEHDGAVVTAHHKDDIVETVALNIQRGGRWRGLSCMNDGSILRPMNGLTKSQIYDYALRRRLEWCEDETNAHDKYARNVLRRRLNTNLSSEDKDRLYHLWQKQHKLRLQIEEELAKFDDKISSRYFLTQIDEQLAQEIIHHYILRHTGISLLGAQLERAVVAIKTGHPGTIWQIGGGLVMKLTRRDVIIGRVE